VTTLESLATAAVVTPAVAAAAVAMAPRRATRPFALAFAAATGVLALTAGAWALAEPSSPVVGHWVVVDA